MRTDRLSSIRLSAAVLAAAWTISSQASPAWKPKMSVPRSFAVGTYRPEIDKNTEKRFYKLLHQGKALIKSGEYTRADRLLENAVELRPENVAARLEHARVLLTIGYLTWNRVKVQKAYRHILHAVKIQPSNRDAHYLSILVANLLERMRHGSKEPDPAYRKKSK